MSLTNNEREILRNVIARLNNEREGVAPQVREALAEARLYLQTYCIAPLEVLAKPDRSRHDINTARSLARF